MSDDSSSRKGLRIAVLGTGAQGSVLAYKLIAEAGFTEITLIARGTRLEELQKHGLVLKDSKSGEIRRAQPKTVEPSLDPVDSFDVVFCFILTHQLDADLKSSLASSKAKKIMFLSGNLQPLSELVDLVGAERAAFGFCPSIQSWRSGDADGSFVYETTSMALPITDFLCAQIWNDAGFATTLLSVKEMQSYLRTQPPFFIGLVALIYPTLQENRGATWTESYNIATGMKNWWSITRKMGEKPTLAFHRVMTSLPTFVMSGLFWLLSRVGAIRSRLKEAKRDPRNEPRALWNQFAAIIGEDESKKIEALRI